jgi:hypothetical protein
MTILVLTDIEIKSLQYILKEYYKKHPDTTTKNVITKLGKKQSE